MTSRKMFKAKNAEFRYNENGTGDVQIMLSPKNVSSDASGLSCVSVSFDDFYLFFMEIMSLYDFDNE